MMTVTTKALAYSATTQTKYSASATVSYAVTGTTKTAVTKTTDFKHIHNSNLNNIFLTIEKVMDLCILRNGSNNYKLAYISKAILES